MTDAQILYFLHVSQSLNMSATAEQLHVTQPVISRQIQALEHELKFPLFKRDRKNLTLTPSGKLMYAFFNDAFCRYEQTRAEASDLFYKDTCDISVRLMEYFDNTAIIETISEFQKTYPNVRFYIDLEPTSCSPQELSEMKWDIIFTWKSHLKNVTRYNYRSFMHTEECIIISKNHPLYLKDTLTPEDFIGETICYTRISNLTNKSHIDYSYDMSLYQKIPLPNIGSVLAYIDSGLAFAILETSILPFLKCDYRMIPTGPKHIMTYCWKIDDNKPLIKAFIKEFQKHLSAD